MPPIRRIPSAVLEADTSALDALEALTNYDPRNKKYSAAGARTAHDAMVATQKQLAQLERDIAAARDAAARDESVFHDIIISARNEVMVQYGPDSDELASVGRKKESQRKVRAPRPKVGLPQP